MSDESPFIPPSPPLPQPEQPDAPQPERLHEPQPPVVAVSIDGRIAENKTCRECGYNLRGLKTDGLCPECGHDVALSLLGHELLYASLPWLKEIARGYRHMRNALLLALTLFFLLLLIMAGTTLLERLFEIADILTDSGWANILMSIAGLLFILALCAAGLLWIYGFVLATRVEPRIAFGGERFSARRATRVFATLTAILLGFSHAARYIVPQTLFGDMIVLFISPALTISTLLAATAFVRHNVALLERTAESRVLKEAKNLLVIAYLAICIAAVVFLGQSLSMIFGLNAGALAQASSISRNIQACGGCLWFLLGLGLLNLAWMMEAALRRVVNRANKESPATK